MNVFRFLKSLLLPVIAVLWLLAVVPGRIAASEGKTAIVVFVRNDCQHCRDEEAFLKELEQEQGNIAVIYYRLEEAKKRRTWEELTARIGIPKVTPITVIGDAYLIGFDDAKTTGQTIRDLIRHMQETGTVTDVGTTRLREAGQTANTCGEDAARPCIATSTQSYRVRLPLVGSIDTSAYPLALLAAALGFFDGFNPCAMWVLITFLVILLQVGSRRRMALFAGFFILAEAVMYTFILTVWYKTWDFVRLDAVVTPLVGSVSIIVGFLFLGEWRKKGSECKVISRGQRVTLREQLEKLASERFTLLTLAGILGIAFSVNVIEFACSIGLPQAFTKILELNSLSFLQTTGYIAIYILFYMVDDFLVFGLALYGAQKLHLTTKYSKLSHLIGGIVMVALGLTLIIRPALLRF